MGKKAEREIVKAIESEGLVVIRREDGSKHLRIYVGAPGKIEVGFLSVPHGNNHPVDGWLKLNRFQSCFLNGVGSRVEFIGIVRSVDDEGSVLPVDPVIV